MTRQQVRTSVAEYRRHATLVRQFKARRQALRGQRGSSTGLQHSLAMAEIVRSLTEAGHVWMADALKAWNLHLELGTKEDRLAARRLTSDINARIDDIPVTFSGKRAR